MSGNSFQFKRFTVDQEGCAMKVGTDGVLLGAWCRILPTDKAILDVGTGTGLVALQLAQRTESTDTTVEAVEIDHVACERARLNFEASEWADRLRLHAMPVQEFTGALFDHIVSNPPYFTGALPSPVTARNAARHTATLSYEELVSACDRMLKPQGRISLVLPAGTDTSKMIAIAGARGFAVSRRTEVHSTPESGPKRTLIEFSRIIDGAPADGKELRAFDKLLIHDSGSGTFSAEYRALTRDFYLHF